MPASMTPRQRFLAALQRQPTDSPALGTVTSLATTEAMAACGAAFPQAHADPTLMARLAAFASLDAGFDMIFPLFSVVHEAAALGAAVDWGGVHAMPGVTRPPWHEPDDIRIPDDFTAREGMAVPLEALRLLKAEYGEEYAIVGKVFGPWSLGFHLFGVEEILIMILDDPDKLAILLDRLQEVTVRSALAQLQAGADLLCLADHCSRDMCAPATYRTLLLPIHQRLVQRIPCPLVQHTCGDTVDRIDAFAASGIQGFHYDTCVPARTARRLAGERLALLGGVSNITALLPADRDAIHADVQRALAAGIDIIGPECAIPLSTSLASLREICVASAQHTLGIPIA